MDTKYRARIEKKIILLKSRYKDLCLSLAASFHNEADTTCFSGHVTSSSNIRDLPVLAKEIEILEALVRDLKNFEDMV